MSSSSQRIGSSMTVDRKRWLSPWLIVCGLGLSLLLDAPSAGAHPVSQGAMEIVVGPGHVNVHAVVSNEEVLVASAFGDGSNRSQVEKVWRHAEYLLAHVPITADGRPLVGHIVTLPRGIDWPARLRPRIRAPRGNPRQGYGGPGCPA
jgi:hypothetical protein